MYTLVLFMAFTVVSLDGSLAVQQQLKKVNIAPQTQMDCSTSNTVVKTLCFTCSFINCSIFLLEFQRSLQLMHISSAPVQFLLHLRMAYSIWNSSPFNLMKTVMTPMISLTASIPIHQLQHKKTGCCYANYIQLKLTLTVGPTLMSIRLKQPRYVPT